MNRVLGPALAKIRDDNVNLYWYKIVHDVEYALNNTISKSTGNTPANLLFGINQRAKETDQIKNYIESFSETAERDLVKSRALAAINIEKNQDYNEKYYNKTKKEPLKYKEDDYVMVRNFESTPGVSKKLIPRFKGPYRILKVLRNDRYVLCDVENFQVTQRPYQGVWEAVNMRPWRPNEMSH